MTRLCYKANVQSRMGDTYLFDEVSLGAASLAKLTGDLAA